MQRIGLFAGGRCGLKVHLKDSGSQSATEWALQGWNDDVGKKPENERTMCSMGGRRREIAGWGQQYQSVAHGKRLEREEISWAWAPASRFYVYPSVWRGWWDPVIEQSTHLKGIKEFFIVLQITGYFCFFFRVVGLCERVSFEFNRYWS